MRRGALGALLASVLVGASLAVIVVAAEPAGATTVSTEAELRTAFGNSSETQIDLANDITLTTCPDGVLLRSGVALTVDGHGHTVTQTCASGTSGVFRQYTGSAALTFQNITVTGGNTTQGGGGISSTGPVTVTNSTVTGNTSTSTEGGGGIEADGATITGSTVSNNTASAGEGGGIQSSAGAVTMSSSTITGNSGAGTGGGGIDTVFSSATVTVTDSTISDNTTSYSDGGGIRAAAGAVTVSGSVITGNKTNGTSGAGGGGGINTSSGTVSVTDSTIRDNEANLDFHTTGGGIHSDSGAVSVTGSTISGNSASGGGGIGAFGNTSISVVNSTITGNGAFGGGGIQGPAFSGQVTLVYTTVVGNTTTSGQSNIALASPDGMTSFGSVVALPDAGGSNCYDPFSPTTSNGFNFSDDASCGFTAPTDRQNGGDPLLGALADNGGPTQTRLPQFGSPLIDAIPTVSCQADGASGITTDQRGVSRPQRSGCDIGSVEVQPAAPGFYTPLIPARILDTRTPIGGHQSPLGQGQSLDLMVTGQGGVPASGVSAVVLNVTVTDTSAPSFLTVWPTGAPRPNASNLNWAAGVTIPNLVTVHLGSSGKVSFFNNAGSANVIADVVGWYSDGPATGAGYSALAPARILDTRTSIGGHQSPLGQGASLDLTVTGQGGVPASGVSAVVLNVTATDTTAASFLTVWPTGTSQPNVSNLNWAAGVTIPNLVAVKVGAGGQVSIFNNAGTTNVVADVVGWYSTDSSTGHGITSLMPARILDTRTPIGGHQSPLGQGGSLNLTVTGVGGVPPTGVSAVVLNVTVTNTNAASFLTLWPAGGTQPNVSNLNWAPGVTIPNLVVVGVGTANQVSIFNNAGSTDVIADVVGWF